ncbi:MAG: heliorhodopsin HeR [Chloroflexi bacterium]|nr:heliorhodopsin HeR [Chloroflexota bacterium]
MTEPSMGRLRLYNAVMGVLHAVQGIAVVLLSTEFALPVTAAFMEGPPGSPTSTTELFDLPIGPAVAAFLFLSALAHFLLAGSAWGWYRRMLAESVNYARWIEYSVSSSLMIVLIAMLTGIADIAALVGLFGVNASMIMFGWLQERYERPGRPGWLPFIFGSFAGIVPWIAIGIYLWSPGSAAEPPAFVYGIFVSLFVFFNSFALNMVLQYRQVGPWRDYLFGERVYVLLSLTAKSALAWQVFAGTLVPA